MYEAFNINTDEHYACKVVAFKGPIPQSNIKKESEFKRRVRDKVEIVKKASHVSLLPTPARSFTYLTLIIASGSYRAICTLLRLGE